MLNFSFQDLWISFDYSFNFSYWSHNFIWSSVALNQLQLSSNSSFFLQIAFKLGFYLLLTYLYQIKIFSKLTVIHQIRILDKSIYLSEIYNSLEREICIGDLIENNNNNNNVI